MNPWSAMAALGIAVVAYVGSYALVRRHFTTAVFAGAATAVPSFMHGVDSPLEWVTDLGSHRWLATLYRPLILADRVVLARRTIFLHKNGYDYDAAD